MDEKNLSKLVQAKPQVLGCNIEANLEPKFAWLQERLGMDGNSLSKMIKWLPTVLGCGIEENLEPTLSWRQAHDPTRNT
jgi:hypothetical protein